MSIGDGVLTSCWYCKKNSIDRLAMLLGKFHSWNKEYNKSLFQFNKDGIPLMNRYFARIELPDQSVGCGSIIKMPEENYNKPVNSVCTMQMEKGIYYHSLCWGYLQCFEVVLNRVQRLAIARKYFDFQKEKSLEEYFGWVGITKNKYYKELKTAEELLIEFYYLDLCGDEGMVGWGSPLRKSYIYQKRTIRSGMKNGYTERYDYWQSLYQGFEKGEIITFCSLGNLEPKDREKLLEKGELNYV